MFLPSSSIHFFPRLNRSSGWIHSSAALGMEAFSSGGGAGDEESGQTGGGMSMFGRGPTPSAPPAQSNPVCDDILNIISLV